MASPHPWHSFLNTADEFMMAYASSPITASAAPLFMIGHAMELYLKAANAKITGDIDRAVGFGHNIKKLWEDCKAHDPAFMNGYEIREAVYKEPFLEKDIVGLYSKADALHYLANQDFYMIAKHLMDLKYLGAPLKTLKGPYAYAFGSHHPYWIKFFKEIRLYLGHPGVGSNDMMRFAMDHGDMSRRAKSYLEELYK